ncbi:hypothetical protein NLX86_14275 [Streptomyces sp. A3M-1-3]|uniref:hypothetical protein n=1 Tax=Streptomyces sp. A3M-1-3 TaxID=2962044 RepID=UPI0020B861C0|nr:hypothetical protein [Streptomyces sp. A3M-1-3]MCP3819227.1 hypothetical protein [Streptomyces sp. A3M-1-3]
MDFRRTTYGHHPLKEFVDCGSDGTGEPVAAPPRLGLVMDHRTMTSLVAGSVS